MSERELPDDSRSGVPSVLFPALPVETSVEIQDLFDDYLDHVLAPMIGVVPIEVRRRIRAEALDNLEGRTQGYIRDGMAPRAAADAAIRKFGESTELSSEFIGNYTRQAQPEGSLGKVLGPDIIQSALYLGQATLWGLIFLHVRINLPSGQIETFGMSLRQIRQFIPEPFPLPEKSAVFWGHAGFMLLAPIVAGGVLGLKSTRSPIRDTLAIMVTLTAVSLLAGLMLLPNYDGVIFSGVHAVLWIPAATISAHLGFLYAQRKRLSFKLKSREATSVSHQV
ncbi:MAG: permease prefix domain 1-containing protein [Fimbriimonadaceae bacterium]|nr:permease prefix domain 1-containing protein [Fimbriimonadaceae bacterium]